MRAQSTATNGPITITLDPRSCGHSWESAPKAEPKEGEGAAPPKAFKASKRLRARARAARKARRKNR